MPALQLLSTRTFDDEMNRLRCECFGQYPSGDSKDEFDDRSLHVTLRVDGKLACYGRMTPGPDSFFKARSAGVAPVPTGPDVVDFGRVGVPAAFRGTDHSYFELVLVEGLLLAADMGFRVVVGAFDAHRKFRPFIYGLGFEDSGPVVQYHVNGELQNVQFVVAGTSRQNRSMWSGRKNAALGRFRAAGYEITGQTGPVERSSSR